MNKNTLLKYCLFFLLPVALFISCDRYERTEAKKSFFVDHRSLSLFVGEEIQLKASPTDGTYRYEWKSENPSIATVDADGKVSAVGEGNTDIIVSAGDIVLKIPLTAAVRIPLKDVELNTTSIEGVPGDVKTVLVKYIPENANDIPKDLWSSEDPQVALVSLSGEISLLSEGTTDVVYRIGNIEKKVTVNASYTRPFKGPHIISSTAPLKLMAAHFDFGGEKYAFHDSDKANHTGNNYRKNNGDPQGDEADIEGDGVNIGYTNAGEWFLYTVVVQDDGEYLFDISESAGADGGKFYLEVDEVRVTETINVPNNGSWGAWRWHPATPVTIKLTKGTHKIKFCFEGGGFNLNALRFIKK